MRKAMFNKLFFVGLLAFVGCVDSALAEGAPCPLAPADAAANLPNVVTTAPSALFSTMPLNAASRPHLDAYDWLLRMIFVVENLEYRGQLIYRRDNQVQSLMLKQLRDRSGRYQTFSMAEGVPSDAVALQSVPMFTAERLPGLRQVLADPALSVADIKNLLQQKLAAYDLQLDRHSKAQVANKACQRLWLTPKDRYRFGYLLDLDADNGMLLRLQLLDENKKTLEEFFFTYIHYFSCPEEKAAEAIAIPPEPPSTSQAISPPNWVPRNFLHFKLLTARQLATEPPAKQLVYSDGLAMISVFVRHPNPYQGKESGFFRLAVLNGYQGQAGTAGLLIIGVVPLSTIQAFQQVFRPQLQEKFTE